MLFNRFSQIGLALFVALPLFSHAQKLPTNITAVPFYDVTKKGLSFEIDKQTVSGMFEVPGMPEHFLVLGYYGFIYSLYPDMTKTYKLDEMKDYTKKEIGNFNSMVRKGMEQGAHGAAFDPNFKENQFFYVVYNKYANPSQYKTGVTVGSPGDGPKTPGWYAIDRWVLSKDLASIKRDTTIFIADKGTGHGAANIVFGKDGYLYVSVSSYGANSWDLTEYMRKILRIDVSKPDGNKMYSIPTSNPFYSNPDPKIKKEIFAYGFRNSYVLSADYLTGSVMGGEVGQGTWEEVNVYQPGKNYGWGNGGDGQQPFRMGVGIEGPCSELTPNGSAYTHDFSQANSDIGVYKSPFSFTGTESGNKKFTCGDFTNATWSFSHSGNAGGGIPTALNGTGMNCIVLSPAIRGQEISPFYGYHLVSDVAKGYFIAIKEGVKEVQKVGQFPNTAGFHPHNGITSFAEDSYGNLYVTLMHADWSESSIWYDIYRLSSPDLKPLTTPRSQVFGGTGGVTIKPTDKNFTAKNSQFIVGGLTKTIEIPSGFTKVAAYSLKGEKVYQAEVESENFTQFVPMPNALNEGTFTLRYSN